ncbi:uncharacterized protein UDID_19240 [Ustilago sp. UG-2017a]|nr:uncharacterized protein UDID_19240 [Ustilago sp. UG-2017a]
MCKAFLFPNIPSLGMWLRLSQCTLVHTHLPRSSRSFALLRPLSQFHCRCDDNAGPYVVLMITETSLVLVSPTAGITQRHCPDAKDEHSKTEILSQPRARPSGGLTEHILKSPL